MGARLMSDTLVKVPVTVVVRIAGDCVVDTALYSLADLLKSDYGFVLDWQFDSDAAEVIPGEPCAYQPGDAFAG